MNTINPKFLSPDRFINRHLGPSEEEAAEMLKLIGYDDVNALIHDTIPDNIRRQEKMDIPTALSEFEYLTELKQIAGKNKIFKNFIGRGYYGTITPTVISRNIFQNPGWYTQYTPYQAEIAQGRLEALLNFQTMVSDLTGLPIANASLLDEGTAAAEAMHMFYAMKAKKNKEESPDTFLVDTGVLEQTYDVLLTRAEPLDIKVKKVSWKEMELDGTVFGILLQYPDKNGSVDDYRALAEKAKAANISVTVAADLLALTHLMPPGEWGADAVVGNTQRLGVPMGYGGPHAAYFSTHEEYKRNIPGRIIGVSIDVHGNRALRMALQTREQHIKREKATSNICTAQALLAIMAGMYGVYHGPKGLKAIAARIHSLTVLLGKGIESLGLNIENTHFFDTISINTSAELQSKIREAALKAEINFFYGTDSITIAVDETHAAKDIRAVLDVLESATGKKATFDTSADPGNKIPETLARTSEFMTHEIFHRYHTESNMMRYIKSLENKDLSLMHSMISLGSCTMKLNAASELIPVSWDEFANIHPFVPQDQVAGYNQIFKELEYYLCQATGFEACSLQPNSGAQGEYAGLLTIRAYHQANGGAHRNIALIPASAHGTNPASAVMAGMDVVVIPCDDKGNIIVEELKRNAELHKDNLSCLMVTYPSTHGVFETAIKEICDIIHTNGGLVYMDGANMNAQVGLTSPGHINADVCHLNLHKTFAIPHGGGGPGMGPICVNKKLAPYLPSHVFVKTGGEKGIHAVSATPYGSASIVLISYGYIRMLGERGLTLATKLAIMNANYIKAKLQNAYEVLYTGEKGNVAHELIVDLRPFKAFVSAEDVAKRLMDYGFHAPTLSFPVAGTIMIEPTESESKSEIDRFCDALLEIKKEIDEIATGKADAQNNVLANAPHTQNQICADVWDYPYSREKAAFPLPYLKSGKFWATIGRVNNAFGDRNLICVCPPIEDYIKEENN